ncbi:MAG: (Fe-S)-binding protein [Bacteroidota bacterium]
MEFGLKNLIFILIFLAAFGFFAKNVVRLIGYLKLGQPENRTDNIAKRIWLTLKVAIFQTKILRESSGGTIHAWIFWGFLILLFAASNSVFTGFGIHHLYNFLGPVYSAITFFIDLFCVLIIIAVVWALLRRYVMKVKRLQVEGEQLEAGFILMMIFVIVSSLLIENATAILTSTDASNAFRPISAAIAPLFSPNSASTIHEIAFWVHILFIFAFMNYLPYSKHLHVLTSVPNVFLGSLSPVNKLKPINFEAEGVEKFGVVDIEDLTWKQLLDGYTCTHCGRCTSVCPANTTGKKLDPREIIMQIRHRTFDVAPILLKKQKENAEISPEEQAVLDKKFVGDYEDVEALWQCTSCGACIQECPVMIEHVPAIIDMRRSLVMMEANFPSLLQNAFGNLETNATPWAFSQSERARWAEDLGIRQAAEHPEFDILFWVGCAGSYDDRAIKISRAFATLMQKAGINFAILGTEEQCTGDVARRAGNEYLADMLVKANIETLNRYNVKKIVTICPHCFNTLKNEYPDFGGKYEVVHHTEFLLNLINEGKLKLKPNGNVKQIAYHDSCYLGRYNEIYDKPRTLLQKAGYEISEVARSGDRGFCCGAGGAQMFMEETEGKRVNIERTEELLSTGCSQIAVNCPFCTTMITDGTKAKDAENVAVRDIAEILLDCVE